MLHDFGPEDPERFSIMVTDAEETFAEVVRRSKTPAVLTVLAPRSVSVVTGISFGVVTDAGQRVGIIPPRPRDRRVRDHLTSAG